MKVLIESYSWGINESIMICEAPTFFTVPFYILFYYIIFFIQSLSLSLIVFHCLVLILLSSYYRRNRICEWNHLIGYVCGENNKTGAQLYVSHLKLNSLTEWIFIIVLLFGWIKDLYDSTAGGRLRNLIFAVILFIRLTVSCFHCYVLHTAVCCVKEGNFFFFLLFPCLPFNILFCILWVFYMLCRDDDDDGDAHIFSSWLTFLFYSWFFLLLLCLVFKLQIFD